MINEIFNKIYNTKEWQSDGSSLSGPGGLLKYSEPYINLLNSFINNNKIKSILDIGCGDFNLMKYIINDNIDYLGVDISNVIIEQNIKQYPNIKFKCLDISSGCLKTHYFDLVLIKDVFQHLHINTINNVLQNLPNFKHCIITNDILDDNLKNNQAILDGEYSPINLHTPPFNYKGSYILIWTSHPYQKGSFLLS